MSVETRGVVTPPRLARVEVARLTQQMLAARLARAEARVAAGAPGASALTTVIAEVPTLAGLAGPAALTASCPTVQALGTLAEAVGSAAGDYATLVAIALESSLASAGFAADAARFGADGRVTVVGRDGERRAIVRIHAETGDAHVDVSRSGFGVTDECRARHDEVLEALASHGLTVTRASTAARVAIGVREAVAEALPEHAVRHITDEGTLRILALPPQQRLGTPDRKES